MISSSSQPGQGAPVQAPQPRFSQEELDRLVTFYKNVQSNLFSQAAAYNNVIIAAGYAGAFALWNVVKGQLSATAANYIVLSLGLSLFFFIAWNVFTMIWIALERSTYGDTTKGLSGQAYIKAYEAAERATLRRYQEIYLPLWRTNLIITIVLGMIGVCILLCDVANYLLKPR